MNATTDKWVSAPVCERCWVDDQIHNGPELKDIREPVRVVDGTMQLCFKCGYPTWCGIYQRTKVPISHPLAQKED